MLTEDMNDHDFLDPPEGDAEGQASVALVSTVDPYPLRVVELVDESVPEGMVCMGSYLGERLIARSAVPPEMIAEIADRDVFDEPVHLVLAAVEEEPGLQCRLFALLAAEQFQESDEPAEPWAASVPKFEDSYAADAPTAERRGVPEEAVVPILLGHVVRFDGDRKHPNDLAAEAEDILRTILADETPLASVIDKVLEQLLAPERKKDNDANPTEGDVE
jgi:hypothetical protein